MGRKRHTAEQIIRKLREAEVELAKGQTTVSPRSSSRNQPHWVNHLIFLRLPKT